MVALSTSTSKQGMRVKTNEVDIEFSVLSEISSDY